jgi:hypothetical protein
MRAQKAAQEGNLKVQLFTHVRQRDGLTIKFKIVLIAQAQLATEEVQHLLKEKISTHVK